MYIFALLCCSVFYMKYALTWYWILLGIVEVIGFFYFSNILTKDWQGLSIKSFSSTLFKTSLGIRIIYVLFSYCFYYIMTDGTYFDMNAGDVLFYDDTGRHIAYCISVGNFNLLNAMYEYAGSALSDSGYSIYLGIIYFLTDNSIIVVRLLKAIWSAWTVLLIYKIAQRNFGESTARMAAIMCMLMPNLIYYCGLHLKEIEMVFLEVLFVERIDYVLRAKKIKISQVLLTMLIPIALFTIRTALAAVLILAFGVTLLLSKDRVISKSKRVMLIIGMAIFVGVMVVSNTSIAQDVVEMWQTKGSQQEGNMEWRSERKDSQGRVQKYAKYAGAAVFAPMIFTIPFPTMVETEGQENQKMIHGGNFDKNITSFFTILSLLIILINGDWRKYVLPISVLCGYLVVITFSNFAHSERFHLPSVPFAMMFAAYGISIFKTKQKYQRWFGYWCALIFVAAVAWNWFKLSGRGMI